MSYITDRVQVLTALKQAGTGGVHSFDLMKQISPRVAARIQELRLDGHMISATREKKGKSWGVRYTLEPLSPLEQWVQEAVISPQSALTPESEEVRQARRDRIAKMREQFQKSHA
jgi:hypothetical protein